MGAGLIEEFSPLCLWEELKERAPPGKALVQRMVGVTGFEPTPPLLPKSLKQRESVRHNEFVCQGIPCSTDLNGYGCRVSETSARRSGPEVKTWKKEVRLNCGNEKPQPGGLGQD